MEQNNLPVLSGEAAKAKLAIAFTNMGTSIQAITNEVAATPICHENKDKNSAIIKKIKEVTKAVVEKHKTVKQPGLDYCQTIDAAKRDIISAIEAISAPYQAAFDKMCAEEEVKSRQAAIAKQREQEILQGIETNVITFSQKIAACETKEDLLSVERLINLEKSDSRKAKYGDHHQKAMEKYDAVLIPLLKEQKETVAKKEAIQKQLDEAEKNNDVEKLDELTQKMDLVTDQFQHTKIKVQEQAVINAAIDVIPVAEEVFLETKGRKTYDIEIVDENIALKKARNLLSIEVNKATAKVVLDGLKEDGTFDNADEKTIDGIRYFVIKKYK